MILDNGRERKRMISCSDDDDCSALPREKEASPQGTALVPLILSFPPLQSPSQSIHLPSHVVEGEKREGKREL